MVKHSPNDRLCLLQQQQQRAVTAEVHPPPAEGANALPAPDNLPPVDDLPPVDEALSLAAEARAEADA